MDNERLNTNPSSNHSAKRVTKERRTQIEELLRAGTPILEAAKLAKMSPNNVMAIKRDMPEVTGISIDKIQLLQDQPQAVVEHRFSISHDALDKLLKAKGQGVKVDQKGVIDLEPTTERPQATQHFLDWAKDPRDFLGKTVVHDNPSHESTPPVVGPPPPPSNDEPVGED